MRPFGSKSEQGKALQLVQRGTDKRIPVELVKQPSGEVLDPAELEELSVKVASESGGAGCVPVPHAIEDKKLVVEVTAEVTRQLGLGVYTLTATGRIPDPAYADGYHDYEIVAPLCKVTKYGSNETPVKVQANVLEGLRGLSAYEIAVKHGYQGTEEEWIKSLTPKGGAGGGGNGKSAYELAVQDGFKQAGIDFKQMTGKKDMPEITGKTYEEIMGRFDKLVKKDDAPKADAAKVAAPKDAAAAAQDAQQKKAAGAAL